MIQVETICLILIVTFLSWELDKEKPIAYPLGNGDTLMVRIHGYGFCPTHCDVDHFHTGHLEYYNCEGDPCNHITINENWSRKTYSTCLDVPYGLFHVWNVDRPELHDWFGTCIYTNDNATRQALIGKFKSSWECF